MPGGINRGGATICDHYKMVSGGDETWTCVSCGAIDPERPKYDKPRPIPVNQGGATSPTICERLRAQAVNAAKAMQIMADAKTARQTDRDDAWTTAGYAAPTEEQTLEWKAADTIEALVEALEPFARIAADIEAVEQQVGDQPSPDHMLRLVPMRHLRAASAALATLRSAPNAEGRAQHDGELSAQVIAQGEGRRDGCVLYRQASPIPSEDSSNAD